MPCTSQNQRRCRQLTILYLLLQARGCDSQASETFGLHRYQHLLNTEVTRWLLLPLLYSSLARRMLMEHACLNKFLALPCPCIVDVLYLLVTLPPPRHLGRIYTDCCSMGDPSCGVPLFSWLSLCDDARYKLERGTVEGCFCRWMLEILGTLCLLGPS